MPFPLVTCMLVLAGIVASADLVAGASIAIVAGVIQFFLAPVAPEQKVPDGIPDEDTYSI